VENEVYDAFYRAEDVHWWFRGRRRILASVLERLYPDRDLAVADVGCGTGGMAALLARFGRVTGVDASPLARDYCARRGLTRVLSPEDWRRDGERYDLVTAFDVVEHVDDDVAFLRSLGERLLPAGRVLVTVPAYPFLWSTFDEMNHHRRRYTRGTLLWAMEEAGVRVEHATYMNTFLLPALAVSRLAERFRPAVPEDPAARARALEAWFHVGPLNGILEAVFAAERHWIRRGSFPAGSSILAWGKREGS
jgi:SAM-dependent methyltransferase